MDHLQCLLSHSLHRTLKVECRGRGGGQAGLKQLLLWERRFGSFVLCFISGMQCNRLRHLCYFLRTQFLLEHWHPDTADQGLDGYAFQGQICYSGQRDEFCTCVFQGSERSTHLFPGTATHMVTSDFEHATAHGLNVSKTWAFNDGQYKALQTSPGVYDEQDFQGCA